jgi:hypothetical protein
MYMFCYRAICGQLLKLAAEQIVCPIVDSPIEVVATVYSADQKGSSTSSQGIRGYIAVMATVKFTAYLIKRLLKVKQSHYRPGQSHRVPGG